jgi:hypothetical protein
MNKIILIVTGIFVVGITLNALANWIEMQPSIQKFEVVDTYKGCDVVEYSPTNAARYYYFLDCRNDK